MSSRTSTPLLRFFFFEELACSLLLWRQCDGGGPAGFSGVVLGIIVPASKLGLGIRVSPASDGILRIFFFFFLYIFHFMTNSSILIILGNILLFI